MGARFYDAIVAPLGGVQIGTYTTPELNKYTVGTDTRWM